MFKDIPREIAERMRQLETIDAEDRVNGTVQSKRLRQISADTGKFLALVAGCSPPGSILEIGTSAGYSTMWLALACRLLERRVVTFEISEAKAHEARRTFSSTNLSGYVELVTGDARELLGEYHNVAFCFLDAEKGMYADCFEAVVPNLVPGGMLLADNVISHANELRPFLVQAESDGRVDVVTIPIGKGVLFCRKL